MDSLDAEVKAEESGVEVQVGAMWLMSIIQTVRKAHANGLLQRLTTWAMVDSKASQNVV